VTLQKCFSHPRLVIYLFFPTPLIKLKLGLQTGASPLIAEHLDQSNCLPDQQQVLGSAVPLTSLSILRKIAKLLARCNAMTANSGEFRRNWSEEFIECEPERLYSKVKKGA